MIFVFVGHPRNIEDSRHFIESILKKKNSTVIFSTNKDILKHKLPKKCKIIINEESAWYKKKLKKIYGLPHYSHMIQHLRFSDALRYIKKNKIAKDGTTIYKLRTDILNLNKIKIYLKINSKNFYMSSDYAFASTYKNLIELDNIFFSKPEEFLDFDPKIDFFSKNFMLSDKKTARFEWLTYPIMLSTILPKRIFRTIINSKIQNILFFGPKSNTDFINMRYYKDRINFQSEVILLWSILKKNLIVNSISDTTLKLNPNRSPQQQKYATITLKKNS